MLRSRSLLCSLLWLPIGLVGAALPAAGNEFDLPSFESTAMLETTAMLELRWAVARDGGSQLAELTVKPEFELDLPAGLRLVARLRLRADAYDRLEPADRPDHGARWAIGAQSEVELREFYLSFAVGDAHLTVGKQQIVWGQADGLKVLDVVNPQDFREFILEDFEASRIPLWTVAADVPIGDANLQLLWIPDRTYHRLPESGDLFELTSPLLVPSPPTGIAITGEPIQKDTVRPSGFGGDAGFRLSSFVAGWDLSLNYLYHYGDTPAFYRRFQATVEGPSVVIEPKHERQHLVGGTFSNSFGDFALRGEVGATFGRETSTPSLLDADGVVTVDDLAWVLGVDWFGLADTLVSVQWFQQRYLDAPSELKRQGTTDRATFLIRRSLWHERANIELLWLHDLDLDDGLARAKASLELTDELSIGLGVDVFYGDAQGLFGQFEERDRWTLTVKRGL